MRWHQARQSVLAENVANADSPNFAARDLKRLSFGGAGTAAAASQPAVTQAGHIGGPASAPGKFATVRTGAFEVTPDGNRVTIEDQMMKVTENELNYQAVTTLYSRALGLVKTAISRSS